MTTWCLVGGAVWGDLGAVLLLEQAFRFQRLKPFPVSFLYFIHLIQDVRPHLNFLLLLLCLPPDATAMMDFILWNHKPQNSFFYKLF